MSWTGRYYYGRETYFEFMDPDRTSWAPRDALAFGLEQQGGSEGLAGHLERALQRDITRFKRKRRYRDRDIPWFWTVDIPRKDNARLISWVMEYDPGFLDRWMPDLPPEKPGAGKDRIARSGFLTRYRSAIGDDLPDRLFRDITSVTVTLPPDEAVLLEAELGVYGYVATKRVNHADSSEDDGVGPELEPGADDAARSGSSAGDDAGFGPEITKRTSFRGPDLDIVVEWSSGTGGPAGEGAGPTGSAASGPFGAGFGITEFLHGDATGLRHHDPHLWPRVPPYPGQDGKSRLVIQAERGVISAIGRGTGPAQVPVHEMSRREQCASGYVEDYFEVPFGRHETRNDHSHGQYEGEKRPPSPVVPHARNHAPGCEQYRADYGVLGGFSCQESETHERQERHHQRQGQAMDRTSRRYEHADVVYGSSIDLMIHFLSDSPVG